MQAPPMETEMTRLANFLVPAFLMLILLPSIASAGNGYNTYILRSPGFAQAQAACQTYGMTLLSSSTGHPRLRF